uniref:MFS transporter n=1 Tax=Ignisphaera aggregans TaxID=334771 RepID=A0A7J2U5U0_9CREN
MSLIVRRKTFLVFILLGLVSLTADMVYEGARSVGGAYIESLNGPPIASAIASTGDLLGYVFRFISAVIASYLASSAAFWGITIVGYAINLLFIPFLGFTNTWYIATALYLVERTGRGLRTPLRDVILAEVSEDMGKGKGFGIHELLDQLGAIAGPLLVSIMITLYGYRIAFLSLLAPAFISMSFVTAAYMLYPRLKSVELSPPKISFRGLGRGFYIYILSMALLSLGYVHWMNVSYFLKYWNTLTDSEIALAYMVAMLTDAAIAIPIGVLYDKVKFKTLYIAPTSALLATILFIYTPTLGKPIAYAMAGLWGVTMGCFETIMRASIADVLPQEKRALGYGVYGLIYGITWTVGSFIYSYILLVSSIIATLYAIITLVASALLIRQINIS